MCGELPAHSVNTSIAVPHKNFYPQPFTRRVITEEIKAAFDPADEGLVRVLVKICARIGDRHIEKIMQMPVAAELLLVKLPVNCFQYMRSEVARRGPPAMSASLL